MRLLCECNSERCDETIDLDVEEAARLRKRGSVVISNGCAHGPEPTDRLIERRAIYAIYAESPAVGES